MKKQLTLEQFQAATKALEMSEKTKEIAKAVLVDGQAQTVVAANHGLTKGAISQTVSRVWAEHEKVSLPGGFERVVAVLPEHQAFIVKKWAKDADLKRGIK